MKPWVRLTACQSECGVGSGRVMGMSPENGEGVRGRGKKAKGLGKTEGVSGGAQPRERVEAKGGAGPWIHPGG